MKYFLLSLLFLASSCAQVKYSENRNEDFGQINTGVTYVVFGKENFRKRLTVNSINESTISATDAQGNSYILKKEDLLKIRKNNTGSTVALSYLGAGVGLTLLGAYLWTHSPRTSE